MSVLEDWKAAEARAEALEAEFRRRQLASMGGEEPPPTAEELEAMMDARQQASVLLHQLAAEYAIELPPSVPPR